MPKDILLVGTEFKHSSADYAHFHNKKHFPDYETIVVDPHSCLESNVLSFPVKDNYLQIERGNGNEFIDRFILQTQKITNYVNEGGTALVFARHLPLVRCYDSRANKSEFDMNTPLPWGDIRSIEGHGSNIQLSKETKGGSFDAFWRSSGDIWRYETVFQGAINSPLAHVFKRPDDILSFIIITERKGVCVVTPIADLNEIQEQGNEFHSGALLDSIRRLVTSLRETQDTQVDIPDWTAQYRLPTETAILSSILDHKHQIQVLQNEIQCQNERLNQLKKLKVLFSGTGTPLEDVVEFVLSEMGMTVTPGDKGRVDWVAEYKDKKLAIEVQGVKKSAKEDHARSLTQWVQEVAMANDGIEPKGLLIVNAYRETELEKRGTNPWVGHTPAICKKQEFCAITGLQLLGIYLEANEHPEKIEEIIEELFSTIGPFERKGDWSKFIEFEPSEASD